MDTLALLASTMLASTSTTTTATISATQTASISPYDIIVLATPVARTGGSAHVLRGKQLERYKYDDPHAILSMVPGVYTRTEDGAGLRPNIGLRGVNPDRSKKITLTEDGVLFAPAPYAAPAAYYFPIITRMPAVRVVKGPGSISFGPQTVGGALDLVTRAITSTSAGAFDLAGGQYLYGKAHGWYSWSNDKVGFLLEGIHLREDGFKELRNDADTGFFRNEWMAKAQYSFDTHPGQKNRLELKGTYSNESSRETYLGLSEADFRANPYQRYWASELDAMKWHRTSVVLTHELEFSDSTKLRTAAYRHDLSRTWRKVNAFAGAGLFQVLNDPTEDQNRIYYDVLRGAADTSGLNDTLLIGPNQRDFVAQGVESRLSTALTTAMLDHRLEFGARLHYDRVERRHSEDQFELIGGQLLPAGTPTEVTAFNEASALAVALLAHDAISWGDLTLTGGARVEIIRSEHLNYLDGQSNQRTVAAVLPGISAYYGITSEFGVFTGLHRGFSPPPPDSTDETSPELSINYEAGVRYSSNTLRAEVIGFYNDYSNLTDICTFSSGCLNADLDRQFDAGEALIYGLEAYLDHETNLGGGFKLPISGAYTFTDTELKNTFQSSDPIFGNVLAGDELPYVPQHQARISVGLEHAGAGLNISMNYVSAMRELPGSAPLDQSLATDEQVLFDAGASINITDALKLYLQVRNIFDETYLVSRRPFGARPNAPRWIQVGLRMASF